MKPPIFVCLFPTPLAQAVARHLHTNLLIAQFQKFSDSECSVTLQDPEQFHGEDVHIFQSTGMPVNDTVLGVAFLAQQLKQAGARRVILLSPYFGYSRQDISNVTGGPGHAQIIARLFEGAGVDELVTVELHNPVIKNLFSIPVHELSLTDAIAEHIKRQYGARNDLCLVAPDQGAHERVAKIALLVGASMLVFSKERYAADKTRVLGVSGACIGKTAILIDDIIDTGGTAINVAVALKEMQYAQIIGYFIHPVFSGDAFDRIDKSPFAQLFVSNTLQLAAENRKVAAYDISTLLAEFVWQSEQKGANLNR